MTGHRRRHGQAWEGIGPPTGEPGQANQNVFFTTKVILLQTEILLSTPSPSSDDPTGEEAGCEGPGLAWLHIVCGGEANFQSL